MAWFWKTRRARDRDLERELESHLALEAEDRAGDEHAARRVLGNLAVIREDTRAEWRGAAVESVTRELMTTMRGLVRRPVVALSVMLTLGLGIGAATTIFSIVDGVVFRPLPYDSPDAMVTVGPIDATDQWIDPAANLQRLNLMSFPDFAGLGARERPFGDLAAIQVNGSVLSDAGSGPEAIQVGIVSPRLFGLLGASTSAGRTFLPDDYRVNAPRVAMITHSTWIRRFGGRSDVLNRPVSRLPAWTLVGVLSPDFRPPEVFFPDGDVPEFWTPLPIDDSRRLTDARGRLHVIGRLAPGASLEAARQEATRTAQAIDLRRPGAGIVIGVNPLHAHTIGTSGRALGIFLTASGLLLLLAVLNASTILLARSLDAAREVGVRMALGASRARIVRATLVEAGLLAVGGGALGVVIAFGGVAAFLRYVPAPVPRLDGVAVDLRVLAVATIVAVVCGLAAGLLPAVRQSATGPAVHLRKSGRAGTEAGTRTRRLLLVGQIAVAVILLCGAGLLANSFMRVTSADVGFEPDNLITVDVSIGAFARAVPGQFTSVHDAWDRALDPVRAVPGVVSVAGTTSVPFVSPAWTTDVRPTDAPPDAVRAGVAGYAITPGFIQTMGMRLVGGREFTAADAVASDPVALVNEAFVRQVFGGGQVLDRHLVRSGTSTSRDIDIGTIRIVGIVGDVVQARVEDGVRPAIYVPYTQHAGELQVVVRTTMAIEQIAPALRRAAAQFNPRFPVQNLRSMNDRVDSTFASPRFRSLVVGAFAGVATLLAALGLYGFLVYSVRCRERELGIRLALGARRSAAMWLVLRQGLTLALAGLFVGLLATPLLSRTLATMLYGLKPGDPGTFVAVATVLVIVCIAACLIPMWRALRVDPISILKAE